MSPGGTEGVIAGPHPEFTKIERIVHFSVGKKLSYYSRDVQNYKKFCYLSNEVPLLGFKKQPEQDQCFLTGYFDKCEFDCSRVIPLKRGMGMKEEVYVTRGPKNLKFFENNENSGTNILYRCIDCRSCQECKNGPFTEEMSIHAEFEQNLINKSVILDVENKKCVHKLPFTANPETRLMPNEAAAKKVLNSQIKLINKSSEEDKKAVIEFEQKLQDLDYVDYVDNLDEENKNRVLNSPIKYYIPWRLAWSNSQRTLGGCSLNDILPKGSNNLNLVEILIRWTILPWAFHTDIRKMYNALLLHRSDWCYQLYYWSKNLNPGDEPLIKVIKTAIYGVRSSGNAAERALRLTAETYEKEYPIAYKVITKDTMWMI